MRNERNSPREHVLHRDHPVEVRQCTTPERPRESIGVDWRLLHRRCPTIHAAGLIDTLRLARHLNSATSNGLARLVAVHDLTAKIDSLAVGSQPHRALWDTIAAAILLGTLVEQAWPSPPTIDQLIDIAGTPLGNTPPAAAADQPSLFEM